MSVFNLQTKTPFIAINKEFNPPTYDSNTTLHALARSPDGKSMIFATPSNVYSLNLSTHNVTPYQSTAITNVKSLDFDKTTGPLMYMSPDLQASTVSGIGFGDGSVINLPYNEYYRAFWYHGNIPTSTSASN